jgi:hypothetical protein
MAVCVLSRGFSLMPMKHQKAHRYAAFHRFRQFGDYQASGYPTSFKLEARIPSILYGLRVSASQIQRFLSRLNAPTRFKGQWNAWHLALKNETTKCPLFSKTALNKLFVHKRMRPAELYKMHTLSKFYEFYEGKNQADHYDS